MIINREKYAIDCKRHRIDFYSNDNSIETSKTMYEDLLRCGEHAFKGWKPKVADSDASDYYSGYVKDLNREFGIHIEPSGNHVIFEDGTLDHMIAQGHKKEVKLIPFRYRFNKSRFQTFMFDFLETDELQKIIKHEMNA